MALVSGQGTTFNLPNFVGELFKLSPTETPLLSMIGGLTGGEATYSKEFTWQTTDLAAASQPQIVEGTTPVYASRDRAEVFNVCQIFQYGIELSYTKQAVVGQLGTVISPATPILGNQPVQNEMEFQRMLKLDQAGIDVEWSFLNGTFTNPTTNASGRRTRGLITAITTNSVSGASAAVTKAKFDELLRTMYANGAPFRMPVIFCNAFQKQSLSNLYGLAPRDRNIGGLDVTQIETDVAGQVGIVLDRHVPTDTILVADLSVLKPRFLEIPGKGHFFLEPMAKVGAADLMQLYGEIGLEYGPQTWHGKIHTLATS